MGRSSDNGVILPCIASFRMQGNLLFFTSAFFYSILVFAYLRKKEKTTALTSEQK